MKTLSFFMTMVLCLFLLLFPWQCTKKYPTGGSSYVSSANSCVTCHTNADLLKKVAAPLPPPAEDAGEG